MTYLGVRTATSAKADLTRTVGGGGGPPDGVAGCVHWWDVSDNATVTQAAGKVSQLNDKITSGAANLTQGTGTNQPTLTTLNGLQCLSLNGTSQGLRNTSLVIGVPCTIFVVFNTTGGQGDYHRPWDAGSGLIVYSLSSVYQYAGSGSVSAGSTVTPNTATATVISTVFNGASSAFYKNGIAGTAGDTGTATGTAGFTLANDSTFGYGWFNSLGECRIYNLALSTPNRQTVENALRTRWGAP